MSRKLVHRCPHCKSDQVISVKAKGKSDTQQVLEVIGGFAEGYFLGSDGSITEGISSLFSDSEKHDKFLCRECRQTWNIDLTKDETPLKELEEEKQELKSSLVSDCIKSVIGLVLSLGVSIWSFLYCRNNEVKSTHMEDVWLLGRTEVTDWHYSWFLVGLIFIIAAIITLVIVKAISDDLDTISKIKKMDLETFRNSKLRP